MLFLPVCILGFLFKVAAASRTCTSGSDDFYFNVQPKGITVREGGRAFLECNVSNHCNVQFYWTLDEERLENTTRRFQNGSNLVISRVNRTLDAGEFHCIAEFTPHMVSRMSQPANLNILWINTENASVVLESPSEEDLKSAAAQKSVKRIELRCAVDGSADIDVRWLRNGRRLKKTDRYSILRNNKRLVITNPVSADNGVFSCEAENSAGRVNSTSNFVLSLPDPAFPRMPSILIVPQQEILAKVGSRIVFDCSFRNAMSIQWRKVDAEWTVGSGSATGSGSPRPRFTVLGNNSLVISPVEVTDEGYYECTGFGYAPGTSGNSATTTTTNPNNQSYVGRLRVAYIEDFPSAGSFEPHSDDNKYVVGLGRNIEVACVPPRGHPRPSTFWTRRGEAIKDTGRVKSSKDMVLSIQQAQKTDVGEYECVAVNMAGERRALIDISASRPPLIKQHPPSLNIEEGDEAVLLCEYEGNRYPITRVMWEKDGNPLRPISAQAGAETGRIRKIEIDEESGRLVVGDARVSDRGHYVCVLRTFAQEAVRSQPATVSVREKLKFSPEPSGKKLEYKSDAKIQCRATGAAPPKVSWIKVADIDNEGTIKDLAKPITTFNDHIRDQNGTLYIHNVHFEDAGIYSCIAASTQGVIKTKIRLDVAVFPFFTVAPENATVVEGETVWLHCQADGTPTPTVQWDREGLTQGNWAQAQDAETRARYVSYPNHTLMIKTVHAKDAGKFACTAGNRGSLSRREVTLCVKAKEAAFCYCGKELGIIQTCGAQAKIGATAANIPTHTIAIACGAAAGYIILVAILLVYCRFRRKRAVAKEQGQTNGVGSKSSVNGHVPSADATTVPLLLRENVNGFGNGCGTMSSSSNGRTANGRPTSLPSFLAQLQYPRDRLKHRPSPPYPVSRLGGGTFGDVYVMEAKYATADGDIGAKLVLVKELRSVDPKERKSFFKEVDMYAKLGHHPNIATVLGVCAEVEPILLVMEYLEYGNLKQYLQFSRHYRQNAIGGNDGMKYPPPLTSAQMVYIAYQIAKGMECLASHSFVHRDLACRNIIISPSLQAKITSLSLSKDAFFTEYYIKEGWIVPLRWMPAEAFFSDGWSEASDVWSYGVLVWELFMSGEQPYSHLSNQEVIDELSQGTLQLVCPPHVPPSLRTLLSEIWQLDPEQRPKFADAVQLLDTLHVDSSV